MRAIASYVVKGPWQAGGVAAVTALMSVLLLPFGYISGAVIALVTLRMGAKQGLGVVFGAALLLSTISLVLVRNPLAGAVYGIALWLPVWALANSLRRTASQARSVVLASLMGIAFAVVFGLGVEAPTEWWQGILLEASQPMVSGLPEAEQASFQQDIDSLAGMMTGIMAALLSLSLIGSLFLGRGWQAQLYNPGGFGEEFRGLRLGRSISLVVLLLGVVVLLPQVPTLLQDMFVVALVPMALQGLAVAHTLVKQGSAHRGFLVLLYSLLLVMTGQAVLVLAFVGTADNWFDFRRLFGPKGGAE
jgi:hypothetical protein